LVTRVSHTYLGEQNLLHQLNIESIQMCGIDMWYLPRKRVNFDKIYGQDDQSDFGHAYQIEMYVQSFNGFMGDKAFMSKFGVEIRDQMFLGIATQRFMDVIGNPQGLMRPNEGDLIYFPHYKALFEIKSTESRENFYPLGALPTYQLTVELFEYSSETFNTGIAEIDILQQKYDMNVIDWAYLDENGDYLVNENGDVLMVEWFDIEKIDPLADNETLLANAAIFVDWTETNPFGDLDA